MDMKQMVDRINELYHKAKNEGLTPAEAEEQKTLRRQYVDNIKAGIAANMEHVSIQNPDGSITKVEKRK